MGRGNCDNQALSHFALDSPCKPAYTLAAPQGVEWKKVFENQHSAVSNQHSAKSRAKASRKKSFDKAVIRLLNGS
jgi:hypothetical protein